MVRNDNTTPQSTQPDCDTLADLLPAYSMGMTDTAETLLVEELLVHCPEQATALEEYQALSDAMLFSAPDVMPPASLGTKLQALTTPEVSTTVDSDSNKIRTIPFRNAVIAIAGIAAVSVILFGLVLYLLGEVDSLRDENRVLSALAQDNESFLNVLGTGDLLQTSLAPQQDGSNAVATVITNPQRTVGLVRVENFPRLDPGMTYQAWLIRGDDRISAGIFDVDPSGIATLIFTAPQSLANYEALGITPEPAGGSDAPTNSPVVFGTFADASSDSASGG